MESYLAQIVKPRPCCGKSKSLGLIVEIVSLKPAWNGICAYCRAPIPYGEISAVLSNNYCVELFRIKRLPPPSEVEQYDRELKIELPKVMV